MANKSSVEQEQYSRYCFFCGSPNVNGEHHLIFGIGTRKKADEDGIKVHICDKCHTAGKVIERIHDNPMAETLSKMFGQAVFERNECAKGVSLEDARRKFKDRYGQFYY